MNEQINILIAKVLNGEASDAEQQQLRDWMNVDTQHQETFEAMKALWAESDQMLKGPAFDTGAAWLRVSAATGLQSEAAKTRFRLPGWTKISFAAAAVLLAGLFLFRFSDSGEMIRVSAENQQLSLVLPDESRISLRAGAVLEYPKTFTDEERRVTLNGEAFFEITPDPGHPFIIDARSATVQVVGTSFNVACDQDEAKVTVATGKVNMSTREHGKTTTLTLVPGEQGRLKKGTLSKDFVSSDSYLYWKTGVLNFREQSFSNVIKELGNMSQTTIYFDASMPADLRAQVVNISFKDQQVEEMITDLCLITHCAWSKGNDGYMIRAAN